MNNAYFATTFYILLASRGLTIDSFLPLTFFKEVVTGVDEFVCTFADIYDTKPSKNEIYLLLAIYSYSSHDFE